MIQPTFTKKIDYLLISLEALHLNSLQIYFKNHSSINYMEFNAIYNINNLNLFNTNKVLYSYTTICKLIFLLYKTIKKNNLSRLIQIIFTKKQLLNKYIKKFYTLYSNNNYYATYTNNTKLKLKYIAIINLYIIYTIEKYSSIRYLVYYLLT